MEITRVYYFINFNGTFVHPMSVVTPATGYLNANLLTGTQDIHLYNGIGERRYRFTFNLFIEDYPYKENETDLLNVLQAQWETKVPGNLFKIYLQIISFYI